MDPNNNYAAIIHALKDANKEAHKALGEAYQLILRLEQNALALPPLLTVLTHLQRIDATDSKGHSHQRDQLSPTAYPLIQHINADMYRSICAVKGRIKKALDLTSE